MESDKLLIILGAIYEYSESLCFNNDIEESQIQILCDALSGRLQSAYRLKKLNSRVITNNQKGNLNGDNNV